MPNTRSIVVDMPLSELFLVFVVIVVVPVVLWIIVLVARERSLIGICLPPVDVVLAERVCRVHIRGQQSCGVYRVGVRSARHRVLGRVLLVPRIVLHLSTPRLVMRRVIVKILRWRECCYSLVVTKIVVYV
jgi:hypothetical protein